jgi:hypothetical protein
VERLVDVAHWIEFHPKQEMVGERWKVFFHHWNCFSD